jgi:hypothetical protein
VVSHGHDIGCFFSSLQSKQVDNSCKGVEFFMEAIAALMLHVATSPILQACSSSTSWIATPMLLAATSPILQACSSSTSWTATPMLPATTSPIL